MRLLIPALLVAACGGGTSTSSPRLPVDPPDPSLAPVPAHATTSQAPAEPARPWPSTRVAMVTETLHGVTVRDPYRWLEEPTGDGVQAWMTAQDDFARGELAKLAGREELAKRLAELLYYDAIDAPVQRKGRFFYTRKHADKEKKVVYWKQGDRGVEKVLLDPNTWSDDGSVGLGGWWPSYDGTYVAYQRKLNNSDETVTHVREVATGKDLPDTIPGTKYGRTSWSPDGKGFYYTWVPPVGGEVTIADRPGFAEVRHHRLGKDPATDAVVHPATKDPKSFIGGAISRDGKWLVVAIQHGWRSTDVYFKRANRPKDAWTPLVTGVDATFDVTVWRDRFYVVTNDGAPRYRVFSVDPRKPARDAWREIVPESDATLRAMRIVGGKLALTYLRNATSEVEVRGLDGKLVRKVALPPLGSTAGIQGEPDDDTGYIAYTSFTEPQVIYKTSIRTGKLTEWARVKLPFDTSSIEVEQVFYPSKDGTKISMFLLRSKDAKRDGTNPTILYGYGGFNVSLTPGFSVTRAAWLERGGMYAIPNLRGGGEYGEDWHRAGMLLEKQNVFDDFIAAAEYLIAERWTSPAHLGIWGGSNGGLLVGAAMTQRPELYGAVICGVPLLDMLRYHLFGSGKTWIGEYGSAEDPAQFAVLHAYSPYRRAVDLGATRYPAVLMDATAHDDRVDPMHARKMVAVLQANQQGDAPILLRIEQNAGHGGADLVKQQVERGADQLAFLAARLRLPER